jgi:hypothetical protein
MSPLVATTTAVAATSTVVNELCSVLDGRDGHALRAGNGASILQNCHSASVGSMNFVDCLAGAPLSASRALRLTYSLIAESPVLNG